MSKGIIVNLRQGALCSTTGLQNITNQKGFFQTPNTTIFTECYPKGACEVNNVCGTGYKGNICSQCSDGYFKKGGFCKPCYVYGLTGSASSFTHTGSILLTSFLAAFILLSLAFLLKNSEMGFVFILPFYIQVIGVMTTLKLNWPTLVIDYVGGFALFDLNIETLAPECAGLSTSALIADFTFYVVLMTPIWVLIISIFIVFAYSLWHRFYQMKQQQADFDIMELQKQLEDSFLGQQSAVGTSSNVPSASPSMDDIHKIGAIVKTPITAPLNDTSAPKKKKKKKDDRTYGCDKKFLDHFCTSSLNVLDFLFFPLAFQSFAFLNCSYRFNSGLSIYEFGADRICYQPWWNSQVQLSVSSIVIYLLGISLLLWGTNKYRERILNLKHDGFSLTEEFVLRCTHYRMPPFRQQMGFWRVVLLLRKLFVAVIFATLSHYPMIQIVILIKIMFASLLIHIKTEPFHSKKANRLDMVILLVTSGWSLIGHYNFAAWRR